jgi:hypothetical protein
MGEASSTRLCTAAQYAAPCELETAPNHGWALNENIENNPMQSSMVRPFERSRKNI